MKHIIDFFKTVISVVFLIALGAVGMHLHHNCTPFENAEVVEPIVNEDAFDLQLPGEEEICIITVSEVESYLEKIGELSTYEGHYTVTEGRDFFRKILDDTTLKFTKKLVEITCSGIVKVGYDIDAITTVVDNDSHKIYITLPEAKVNDNYIILDSVKCVEENNIFNPVGYDEYSYLFDIIEQTGLEDVESQDIYTSAENHMKEIIELFLNDIPEYEVVFM